jgi:hypothetical protein
MLGAPVLVIGSLPPHGHDLDLLLPSEQGRAVEEILVGAGFASQAVRPFPGYPEGFTIWARFAGGDAEVVDAIPLGNLELPADEVDRLFADARPIPGFTQLRRPAPHHVLLILAHNFLDDSDGEVPVSAGRRRRVDGAVAEEPEALERARALAPAWGRSERLARLERALALGASEGTGADGPRRRRLTPVALLRQVRRYRRAWRDGHIVAFSGPDASRRAVQAKNLARALDSLDIPVEVIRPHQQLGGSRGALARAAAHRRAALPALRRGAVAIADGYLLDAAVEIGSRSGGRRVRLQTAMMRALSPPSRRAYLIGTGAPADAAYAEAASQLCVRSLDGARNDEELSAQIAADVWPAVR